MPENPIFFIKINTSFNNVGDLLINRALLQNLLKQGKVVLGTNNTPEKFLTDLLAGLDGIELTEGFYSALLSAVFSKSKVYLVGIPGHSFGTSVSKLVSSIASYLAYLVFSVVGIRHIKFGNGAGPYSPGIQFFERARARLFMYFGVRDSESIKVFKGIKSVRAFPDMAFLSNDIYALRQQKADVKNHILLSFRPKTNDAVSETNYTEKLINKIEVILERCCSNCKVTVCYQVPSDRQISLEIYEYLTDKGVTVEFKDHLLELNEALELYKSAGLVMSNRLHVILPSLILGTPNVALINEASHSKITSIYRDLGLNTHIVDIFNSSTTNFDEISKIYQRKYTSLYNEISKEKNQEGISVFESHF